MLKTEELFPALSPGSVLGTFNGSEGGLYLRPVGGRPLGAQNTAVRDSMTHPIRTKIVHHQSELFPIADNHLRAKPFLKWAGGKTRLLSILQKYLARQPFRKYFEPFVGGGALFFDTGPSRAVLNDSNPELMLCYEIVRDQPAQLVQALSELKISERDFYRIRAQEPEKLSSVSRAARFIYLNKTCYNGLYRVNKSGHFNTPYGRNGKVSLLDEVNLQAASQLLKNAKLLCKDYQTALVGADEGDFVYLDPPYLPVGKYSDFRRYTKDFFREEDHGKLAELFRDLSARGCFVLLSNSYHKDISELYSGFNQVIVEMPRFINCKGTGRGRVKELLISNQSLDLDR